MLDSKKKWNATTLLRHNNHCCTRFSYGWICVLQKKNSIFLASHKFHSSHQVVLGRQLHSRAGGLKGFRFTGSGPTRNRLPVQHTGLGTSVNRDLLTSANLLVLLCMIAWPAACGARLRTVQSAAGLPLGVGVTRKSWPLVL